MEYLDVEVDGMVKVKLGTGIFAEFEEIDFAGPLLFADIAASISVVENMDI